MWTAAAAALEPTVDESGDALLPENEAADKHGVLGAAADGGKGAAGGAGEIVGPIKLPWAAGGQGGAVGAGEIDGHLMLPSPAGGHGGADSAGEIVGRFTCLGLLVATAAVTLLVPNHAAWSSTELPVETAAMMAGRPGLLQEHWR